MVELLIYTLFMVSNWMTDLEVAIEALEFYANKENWKDLWSYSGHPSDDFKYFYMLRQRTNDFEKLQEPYHYYAGKRARDALKILTGPKPE